MVRPPIKEGLGHAFATNPSLRHLHLPRDVIRSVTVARFRLRAHTLRVEIVIWNRNTSPVQLALNADHIHTSKYKMSSISFSITPIPMWFLSEALMCLYFLPHVPIICLLLSQNNTKLFFPPRSHFLCAGSQSHFLTEGLNNILNPRNPCYPSWIRTICSLKHL